jgi:hypothetical protein
MPPPKYLLGQHHPEHGYKVRMELAQLFDGGFLRLPSRALELIRYPLSALPLCRNRIADFLFVKLAATVVLALIEIEGFEITLVTINLA